MSEIIYKSNRYFTVFDFFVSHSQLLIRASKNEEFEKNIDVIFFNVRYQQLSTRFHGLSVKEISKMGSASNYDALQKYLTSDESHLFELFSDSEQYLVVASFFKVYENDLDFTETSLGLAGYKGRENELVSSI